MERPDDEAYANSYFVNANSVTAPGIVDAACQQILDHSEIYSGVYGRASITFYAFNTKTSRGIACGLQNIQNILDGLMGVGVAVFILISGWGLVMDTLSPLLGERPSDDLVDHIEQTVMSYPGVLGMHDLMVHDYGPGHQFASLHVELPAEQDPLDAHDLIDNIERNFMKNDHLMVTIHYDPIVTSDAAVGVLRTRLTEKLRQLNPALSLHDLRIVPGKTHTNVLFDLVLPAGYAGDKVELLTQMEQFIKEQNPTYNCIIKVEQSYTAAHQS